jgi:hypothetical protein
MGVLNMIYGYKDTIKELPMLPWAEWQDNRVKEDKPKKDKKKTV